MIIKNDSPQDAPPATSKERQAILDNLSKHMTPDRVATLDGVSKRGTMKNICFHCKTWKGKRLC